MAYAQELKDREAVSSPPADPKIADYLENRKISLVVRAQSTLQRIGVAKGARSERPWCADQPSLLIVGMTEK
jgi:hypothetical protein